MAPCPQNILIFGATGLIGRHITRALVQGKQHFKQITVFTSADTVTRKGADIDLLKAEGVKVVIGDLQNDDDVKNAYVGIDTVISCLGRNMIAEQTRLIQHFAHSPGTPTAAGETKTEMRKWFFPSEYGTDVEYGPGSSTEIPHQRKLKVRKTIGEVSGLMDYTYVVTGPYGDGDAGLYLSSNLGATRTGSFDVKNKSAVLLGDGNLKIGLTMMKDVGNLVLAALLHPDQSRNRALKVNSFYTTDRELLSEFESQTGGQPWKVSYTSLDELRQLEKEAWDSGNPLATLITLRRIWAEGGTVYEQTDNDVIGMGQAQGKMTSLQGAVADAIEKQLSESQEVERKLT